LQDHYEARRDTVAQLDGEFPTSIASHLIYYAKLVPEVARRRVLGRAYLKHNPQIRTSIEPADVDRILKELHKLNPKLTQEPYTVNLRDYNRWVSEARYPPLLYRVVRKEKYLEHFVSYDLLKPEPHATIVDVASFRSYFPKILRAKGCRVIVQDLVFPPGRNGDVLGGSASAMELPDGSVDAMTLHCSFEHFEGDSDIGFIRESARILRPGGRVVILPLYLHQEYLTQADPYYMSIGDIPMDAGATMVAVSGYANRHGRHYSPPAFLSRVHDVAVARGLHPILKLVKNAHEIAEYCYLKFALVLNKRF